ncbi:MAG: 3-hydroxyacyl-CoA dehydrogenase NAD-binding domain-containing protein [Polyangiales bacterium]
MAIDKIAIVGCGSMGLGIAESAASHGVQVIAVEPTSAGHEAAEQRLVGALDRKVARGRLDVAARDAILGRVRFTHHLEALRDVDLVIESCAEDLTVKLDMLAKVERHVKKTAILASNTSSLKLADIARGLAHPERFVGLHFFTPVSAMKLVEVAGTAETDLDVRQRATDFITRLDKTPVQIQDTAGYVVNRLLIPTILHAIETLELGVATADAIDMAMKLGAGHPMGPLALADLIGLDVVLTMAKTMHTELRDSRFRAPSLLRRLVLAGHLGRKTQRGIYDYTNAEDPMVNPAIDLVAITATGT